MTRFQHNPNSSSPAVSKKPAGRGYSAAQSISRNPKAGCTSYRQTARRWHVSITHFIWNHDQRLKTGTTVLPLMSHHFSQEAVPKPGSPVLYTQSGKAGSVLQAMMGTILPHTQGPLCAPQPQRASDSVLGYQEREPVS